MNRIHFPDAPAEANADIVIVGAGVSGLYCARRLIEQDPTRRITIVERLNRVGGRLDTDLIEIAPGDVVREEEGGMRFNYEMTELMRLTNALGLSDQIVHFPMGSDVTGLGNTNRFWLRGSGFTAAEAEDGGNAIWGTIYDLAADERCLSPAEIVGKAFDAVMHQNGRTLPVQTGPEFWTDFREHVCWNGVPVNQWQMWGLLRDMGRSQECIQMLSETIGFAGPFKAPINAGDAFQILADFPSSPTYFTFSGGMATLPRTLAAELPSQVTVLLSTNVDAIAGGAGDFTLTLTKAPGDLDSNPYVPGGKNKTLSASTLILAVATNGMERLFITSSALNAQPDAKRLWDNIHAAQGMALTKINLYFEHPWWENGGITPPVQFGPNFTDLPVNAVYPFYSSGPGKGDGIPDGAAALTIYCDFENTNFWAGLQNVGASFDSPLQRTQNAAVPQVLFAASRQVVDEAKNQLGLVFGTDAVPEPILTSYRLWNGENDFEYAYHQWGVGVVDSEVRSYLAAPVAGVHFCNEAISDMQGWVNGSIRSCDLALASFGIKPMTGAACPAHKSAPPATATPRPAFSGVWG